MSRQGSFISKFTSGIHQLIFLLGVHRLRYSYRSRWLLMPNQCPGQQHKPLSGASCKFYFHLLTPKNASELRKQMILTKILPHFRLYITITSGKFSANLFISMWKFLLYFRLIIYVQQKMHIIIQQIETQVNRLFLPKMHITMISRDSRNNCHARIHYTFLVYYQDIDLTKTTLFGQLGYTMSKPRNSLPFDYRCHHSMHYFDFPD